MRKSIFTMLIALLFTTAIYAETVTLEKAIVHALKKSDSIKINKMQIEKSNLSNERILKSNSPRFDLSNRYTRLKDKDTNPMIPSYTETNSFNVAYSQNVYDFNRTKTNSKLEKTNKKILNLNAIKNIDQIKFRIINNFINILKYKKMVNVAQENKKLVEKYIKDTNIKIKQGLMIKADILQFEVRLSQSIQEINNLNIAIENLINELNYLTKQNFTTNLELKDLFKFKEFNLTKDEVLKIAFNKNYDLKNLDLSKKMNEVNLERSKLDKKPSVATFANYTKNSYTEYDYNYGVNFSFNIFDSGIINKNIEINQKSLEITKLNISDYKQNLKLSILRKYLNIKNSNNTINTNKTMLEQSKENLRLTKVAFNSGIKTSTDLLNAQITYISTKANYYNSIYDYHSKILDLYNSISQIDRYIDFIN